MKKLSVLLMSLLFAVASSAQITVTADYSTSKPVPQLGAGAMGSVLQDTTVIADLQSVGFLQTRMTAQMSKIWPDPTDPNRCASPPCWDTLDPNIQRAANAGLTVVLIVTKTPYVDRPSPDNCASADLDVPPVGSLLTDMGNKAASIVGHMDASFPNVVTDYEIWNEPDIGSGNTGNLCYSDAGYASASVAYQNLFHTEASAMHYQASHWDNKVIHIGGPVLGSHSHVSWVTDLLAATGVAHSDVDFVSYHYYPTTQSGSSPAFYNPSDLIGCGVSTCAVWTREHDTTATNNFPTGVPYIFNKIAVAVAAGGQANPTTTPIYVTEYNSNATFITDVYRNTVPYAALFNASAIADFVETPFIYSAVTNPLTKLNYFAGQTNAGGTSPDKHPFFCLYGVIDSGMDCESASLAPYPQYYAFKLALSSSYLDLVDSTQAVGSNYKGTTSGLLAGAWQALTKNAPRIAMASVLLVNPSTSDITNVTVQLQNFDTAKGSISGYHWSILPASSAIVSSGAVTWTKSGNNWNSSVQTIPAQSVVGFIAY